MWRQLKNDISKNKLTHNQAHSNPLTADITKN